MRPYRPLIVVGWLQPFDLFSKIKRPQGPLYCALPRRSAHRGNDEMSELNKRVIVVVGDGKQLAAGRERLH